MMAVALWLAVGVHVWAFASCSITCPDGNVCSDVETCCKTHHGYSCSPYPNAVCCSDLAHCCPAGFRCNQLTQMCEKQGMKVPMVKKEEPMVKKEEPSHPPLPVSLPEESQNSLEAAVVFCDSYTYCPTGTTCCRYPTGHWWCCPFSPGRCCLDGYHCCQLGYDCDSTFRYCVRQGLRFPFTPKLSMTSFPATVIPASEDKDRDQETPMTALTEASRGEVALPMSPLEESQNSLEAAVVFCDSYTYCPTGTTCCRYPTGHWWCCPFSPGRCCLDGYHCCQLGYDCDSTFRYCVRQGLRFPFTPKLSMPSFPATVISAPEDKDRHQETPMTALTAAGPAGDVGVIRCDSEFFCPAGKSCCKGLDSKWTCCSFPLGVCCVDGRHCCAYGYECDATSMTCNKS